MNNLNEGLDSLLNGIRQAGSLVCLKLRNNKIDGRRRQDFLYNLVKKHPSLTAVDLGNSENIKNRNRLYNEGFEAIIQGILQTPVCSLISELNLQSTCITSDGF